MAKINKILLLVLAIIVLYFIINWSQVKINQKTNQSNFSQNSTANPQKDKFASQKNEGGNVTVAVYPEILEIGQKPKFKLEFSTHSVDLSFDIAKQSYLLDNKGYRLDGSTWSGTPPGGHHRSGTLTFINPLAETKYVELIIKDVAGVSERKFKWNL